MRRVLVGMLVVLGGTAAAPAAQGAVSVGPPTQSVGEAAGTVSFTVTRGAVGVLETAAVPVTVSLGRAGDTGSCPADVTPCSATVSVAGSPLATTTATVSFSVVGDTLDEVAETLGAHVTAAPGEEFDPAAYAVASIVDDDAAPAVGVGDASVAEGTGGAGTAMTFPVTLGAVSGRVVTVGYALTTGTASGADLALGPGTVTIPAGQTTAQVPVTVVADAVDEDAESFTVTLRDPDGASVERGTATGSITDDDEARLSVTDAAAPEGTPLTFTVSLSTPSSKLVSASYATADGTAVAPGDYGPGAGSLTLAPGETSRTFQVATVGDAGLEADEAFFVALGSPGGTPITRGTATGVIVDDDVPPPVTAPPPGIGGVGLTPGAAAGDDTSPQGRLEKLVLRSGRLRSAFTCPAPEARCRVAVTVFTVPAPRSKVKRLRRELQVAAITLTVPGGARRGISMRLPARTMKLLRQAKRTRVRGYAVVRDAAGNVGTTQASGVLKP